MLSQKEFNMHSNISALSKLLRNQIRWQQRKVRIELRSSSILSALQKHTAWTISELCQWEEALNIQDSWGDDCEASATRKSFLSVSYFYDHLSAMIKFCLRPQIFRGAASSIVHMLSVRQIAGKSHVLSISAREGPRACALCHFFFVDPQCRHPAPPIHSRPQFNCRFSGTRLAA